ncbi:MAG: hypothetical protein ACKOJH_03665 [Actinomycetota bacterium]
MADIRLIFDAIGQRWEGVILPVDQWTALDEYNDLLTIAYSDSGALAGFVFDLDSTNSATSAALSRVRELFGEVVADRVSSPDNTATAGTVAPLSSTAIAETAETAIFPVLGSVNARARDVAIVDDASRGIVKISMRLPWWAALLRPWVTVRRRGRPEVIALGPMRRAKGVHTAELHYGLPTPTSSLVAEVIRGTRGAWVSGIVAAVVTAALLLGGLAVRGGGESQSDDSTLAAVETTVEDVAQQQPTTTLATTTTVASESTDTATTLPTMTTVEPSTTTPAVSTTKPSRTKPITSTTVALLPIGYPFTLPTQYVSSYVSADVAVGQTVVKRGETLRVSVKISAAFPQANETYRKDGSSLAEIVAECTSLIGRGVEVKEVEGWTTSVIVALRGTSATAGGSTQLYVIGNIPRECGTTLVTANPTTISVKRTTIYREVPIQLVIPTELAPGIYDLLLSPIAAPAWSTLAPIRITVTE